MDLKQLDTVSGADQGADLELMTPSGTLITDSATKKPWTIRLLGVDSKKYQDAQHRLANKRIQRRSRSRRAIVTSEELDTDQLELLVEVTTGWCDCIKLTADSAPLPFNRENVRMLYSSYPWIREQAEEFIADRANFLGESLRNSKSTPSTASS